MILPGPADLNPVWHILLPLLYVELHYGWFLFGSRYFRREPEILGDLPWRVEPGKKIPILLMVKDAHQFPITLNSVSITLSQDRSEKIIQLDIDEDIHERFWYRLLQIERPGATGPATVNVEFHYQLRNRSRSCNNHNLPALPHAPLKIFIAGDQLPGRNILWGDLHSHTWFTEDMIEFGAPPEAIQQVATAMGLDFVAFTDHSYDLDDVPGSWRKTDPRLTKWSQLLQATAKLNAAARGAIVIPGEEVSTRNANGNNVHLLLLNHPDFIPGSGDGGERLFTRRSEHSIGEILPALGGDAVAVAAHPFYPIPALQRLILRRDKWTAADTLLEGIQGLQILNGAFDEGFYQGLHVWVKNLLAGRRSIIMAGNDAHGDFNLSRYILFPLLKLGVRETNRLGGCRTGIAGGINNDLHSIIQALRNGACIISNGPAIDLRIDLAGSTCRIGDRGIGRIGSLTATMETTAEMGTIERLTILHGKAGALQEEVFHQIELQEHRLALDEQVEFSLEPGLHYFRAEGYCRPDVHTGRETAAFTNPIWIETPA